MVLSGVVVFCSLGSKYLAVLERFLQELVSGSLFRLRMLLPEVAKIFKEVRVSILGLVFIVLRKGFQIVAWKE